jgi:hypothetical protein
MLYIFPFLEKFPRYSLLTISKYRQIIVTINQKKSAISARYKFVNILHSAGFHSCPFLSQNRNGSIPSLEWKFGRVIPLDSAGMTGFRQESQGHHKDLDIWRKEQEEKEGVKKRLQQLEKLQVTASPTAPLRQQMTSFNIGSPASSPGQQQRQTTTVPANPFTNTSGGRGNLFQIQTTNHSQRPPATQADRAALLVRLQKYPHHPDSDAGKQAHGAQQAEWARIHGLNAFVTESTPYPLRPGTLPVGSGECFTCGFAGHMGRRDGSICGGNRALHPHEQTWRAICSRILRQTRNAAANIQLVAVDDYGTTWQEVQGNEEGPSS